MDIPDPSWWRRKEQGAEEDGYNNNTRDVSAVCTEEKVVQLSVEQSGSSNRTMEDPKADYLPEDDAQLQRMGHKPELQRNFSTL